jgi:LacI family gluconate utilization system Gnt-I transcriptional repressor
MPTPHRHSADAPADPVRPVTMADVAARVGVSKMTVSRALNRSGDSARGASEALRQRILAACDEMGYVIDQTARTFASKRSGFVAVLVPTLNNSNFSETLHGLTAAVEAAGLQLLLGYTDYSIEAEERLIKTMLMRRPEGLVLTGGSHTPAARAMVLSSNVPVVETWDLPGEPLGHAVGFSNADATAAMVHHLHARGYRRIAFVGGVAGRDARGDDRRGGYVRAVQQLGLPEGRVFSLGQAPVPMSTGIEAVALVVQQWPEVDAIVCVSDPPAFGALMECQRRGWAVPGRIAIAGFGDFEVGKACHPRLTTVAVDNEHIGRRAGELLLRAIAAARSGQRLPAETVAIPYRIEQREST